VFIYSHIVYVSNITISLRFFKLLYNASNIIMGKGPYANYPHMPNEDRKLFYKYLEKASTYFEYGSGGSTYFASTKGNINKIYSVENDKKFLEILDKRIRDKNKTVELVWLYVETNTQFAKWGQPSHNVRNEQCISYSNQLSNLTNEEIKQIDFILIDGRFRVACCLKCFDLISDTCLIAFDDFIPRKNIYGIVLEYYNIIDQSISNSMVILQKKTNINSIPLELIQKYELDKS
tara:strand:+ start:735 stop:1436 length:702 start_codon:yes stop_codon:yes gene_type:complete